MKSVTELIENECLLFILNIVTSLRCWWSVALYVQTVVWYDFVFASIIIVEISTFIMQQQLMNFVMLASIVVVKSTLCVLASDISIIEKIVSSPLFTVTC
jgi:hypothetical protein